MCLCYRTAKKQRERKIVPIENLERPEPMSIVASCIILL
jgi:hypothetical protein